MKEKNSKNEDNWKAKIIFIFLRMSGWIVFPVVVATLLGQYLDSRYDTSPWLFLITIGASFVISMIGLAKETLKEYKSIESSFDNDKDSNGSK